MSEERRETAAQPAGRMGRAAAGEPWAGRWRKPKTLKGRLALLGYFLPERYRLVIILVTAMLEHLLQYRRPENHGLSDHQTVRWSDCEVRRLLIICRAGIDFGYIGTVLLILLGCTYQCHIHLIQQYMMAGVAQRTVYKSAQTC